MCIQHIVLTRTSYLLAWFISHAFNRHLVTWCQPSRPCEEWNYFFKVILKIVMVNTFLKLVLRKCHRNLSVISQYWFRCRLGVVRQQTIACGNIDHNLCRRTASLELIKLIPIEGIAIKSDAKTDAGFIAKVLVFLQTYYLMLETVDVSCKRTLRLIQCT